ncbi:MAG TPA: DUF2442 domain-containing protein [Bryobacteraceae bacterium]|nr:DUF2442 domain-containing protein [Bryobacteraceae bacterium]
MNFFTVEANPRAAGAEITSAELLISLKDGRKLSVPLTWFARILHASDEQRQQWELLGDGEGIRWPSVDEDVSIIGLLAGARAI